MSWLDFRKPLCLSEMTLSLRVMIVGLICFAITCLSDTQETLEVSEVSGLNPVLSAYKIC